MSAPLVVSIPHRLGREEATRRLKAGLGRAASSIPTLQVDEERWQDNRMIFRIRALGQAASGHVDVADDHVLVHCNSRPPRPEAPRSGLEGRSRRCKRSDALDHPSRRDAPHRSLYLL